MDRKEARKIVNGSVNWRGARPRRGREGRGGAEISVYETDGRSKNDFQQSFEPHLLTRSRACYASLLFSGRSRFVSRETRSIFGPRPGHRAKFSINGGKNIFSPTSVAASLGNVRARILFRTIDTRSSWFDAIIKTSVHECMRDHRFPLPSEINN